MKNNLADLAKNAKTILAVREYLINLGDFIPNKTRDIDNEELGCWLRRKFSDEITSLALYIELGKGISVNLNSMEYFKVLKGTPKYDEVIELINEFLKDKYGEHI